MKQKKDNTKLIGIAAIGVGLWFLLKPKTAAATTPVVPPTTGGGGSIVPILPIPAAPEPIFSLPSFTTPIFDLIRPVLPELPMPPAYVAPPVISTPVPIVSAPVAAAPVPVVAYPVETAPAPVVAATVGAIALVPLPRSEFTKYAPPIEPANAPPV